VTGALKDMNNSTFFILIIQQFSSAGFPGGYENGGNQ
jgi:hypothetical protein